MTAMAEAMRKAGVSPARDRLRKLAAEAIEASPRNWDGARDALCGKVRGDAELLWEMFAAHRMAAVDDLLRNVAADLRIARRDETPGRESRPGDGTGHSTVDGRGAHARPVSQPSSGMPVRGQESGAGLSLRGNQVGPARPASPPPAAPKPAVAPRTAAGLDAVLAVARLSALDTVYVNGQRIGDVTPREANAWADTHARKATFVRLLTANLPWEQPIRRYRSPDEADAFWEEAAGA